MDAVFDDKKNCCGCKNCLNICPKKAIKMVVDEFGFEYPKINQDLCVNCGKCKAICPMINVTGYSVQDAYAAILNDSAIERSASGGAFYAIAKSFVENGGVVFGCAFDNGIVKKCAVREYPKSWIGDIRQRDERAALKSLVPQVGDRLH